MESGGEDTVGIGHRAQVNPIEVFQRRWRAEAKVEFTRVHRSQLFGALFLAGFF